MGMDKRPRLFAHDIAGPFVVVRGEEEGTIGIFRRILTHEIGLIAKEEPAHFLWGLVSGVDKELADGLRA